MVAAGCVVRSASELSGDPAVGVDGKRDVSSASGNGRSTAASEGGSSGEGALAGRSPRAAARDVSAGAAAPAGAVPGGVPAAGIPSSTGLDGCAPRGWLATALATTESSAAPLLTAFDG